jgi:hypothetical protein
MNAPAWVVLKNPVPPVVSARAVALLPVMLLGEWRVEWVDVDCQTTNVLAKTRVLKYVCELHGDHKGITVFGLV